MEKQFWCCYVEGTGGFFHKHLTEGDARIEAERLASQPLNRDKKVYILEVIAYCQTDYPPVSFHEIR